MSFLILWHDFVGLFYPKTCVTCHLPLVEGELCLCTSCLNDLPLTHGEDRTDNEVSRLFWGIYPIQYATALFFYRKGSRYHNILHEIKYRGNTRLAHLMGYYLGKELSHTAFQNIDFIIPVPLHPKKQRQRGYNQSECIARGIAEALRKPVQTRALIRTVYSPSQTRRGRWDRFENVSGIFETKDSDTLENRHILIVDDVITTGATIDACIEALIAVPGIKISIAALGISTE